MLERCMEIYDTIDEKHVLWLDDKKLKKKLNNYLTGMSFEGMPLRTRSKEVKKAVCKALKLSIPKSFKKTKPKFPIQNLDIYVQKSRNLQIWNDEIDFKRRYGIIILNSKDVVSSVIILSGKDLEKFDTTGKLTIKYQARYNPCGSSKLLTNEDTRNLKDYLSKKNSTLDLRNVSPIDTPKSNHLLSIKTLFERLKKLEGKRFADIGLDQERNRGALIHQFALESLGYVNYSDSGKFPDIINQLLEVKLQTSPTIDLGKIKPDSEEELSYSLSNTILTPKDIRYAIFGAIIENGVIQIKEILLTNGKNFFNFFKQFKGKEKNSKIQLVLPKNYFN